MSLSASSTDPRCSRESRSPAHYSAIGSSSCSWRGIEMHVRKFASHVIGWINFDDHSR
jgi:hypothetical protein